MSLAGAVVGRSIRIAILKKYGSVTLSHGVKHMAVTAEVNRNISGSSVGKDKKLIARTSNQDYCLILACSNPFA